MFADSSKNVNDKYRICLISLVLILSIFSIVFSQEFWQKTNGPETGYVNQFVTNSKGEIFAASRDGYLFISKDFGETWQALTDETAPQRVSDLVINNDNIIFAGYSVIKRSVNNGLTWEYLSTGFSPFNTACMVMNQDGHIFAGSSSNGIIRSMDNGDTWVSVNSGLPIDDGNPVTAMAVNSTNGDLFAAIDNLGVFYSNNNGSSWTQTNLTISNLRFTDLLVNDQGQVFFTSSNAGIYKSSDNGQTWVKLTHGITSIGLYSLASNSSGQLFTCGQVGAVYISSDNGENWAQLDNEFSDYLVYDLMCFGSNIIFAGTYGKGIYVSSDNGNSWQEKNEGFSSSVPFDLKINSRGLIFAGLEGSGIFRTGNLGESWDRITEATEIRYAYELTLKSNDDLYAATGNGLFLSTDDGGNWNLISGGLPSYTVRTFTIDPSNNTYYAGLSGNFGVYKSADGGLTWIAANSGMDFETTTTLNKILMSPNGNLFAATYDGSAPKGIYRSTDNGENWTKINHGLSDLKINTTAINQNGQLFALTDESGLFISDDGGDNWYNLIDGYYKAIAFNSAGHIFLSGSNNIGVGIFRSIDNGQTWQDYSKGLIPYAIVRSILVDGEDNIYAGLYGFGVFKGIGPTTIKRPLLSFPEDGAAAIPTNPILEWQAIPSATEYQLQVSTQIDFSTIGFDESGIKDTQKEISGLKNSTRHFWRVRANNEFAVSDWSEPRTFTTTQAGPSLINPGNGQTQLGLNVQFSWNAIDGAEVYEFVLASDSLFENELKDYWSPNSNYTYEGLNYSSKYYWKVRARLLTLLYTDWSDTWSFTTKLIPPVLNDPSNFTNDTPLALNLDWNPVSEATQYWLQVSENSAFNANLIDRNDIEDSQYSIDGLEFSKTYYWRVCGYRNGEFGEWSETWRFTTVSYPSSYNFNQNFQFPSHDNPSDYAASDYRMFGIPGGDMRFADVVLGSGAEENWVLYWDNGQVDNYFEKFIPDDQTFQFGGGRAFWLLFKGTFNLNLNVSTPSLNENQEAEIPLHSGWNLITNPFMEPVDWSKVTEVNDLGDLPLWRYIGSFSASTSLKPFEGYYIDNSLNRQNLKIPYKTSLPKVQKAVSKGWRVNVILKSGQSYDKSSWFGVSQYAEKGLDDHDYRKPRAIGYDQTLFFDHSDWGKAYQCMSSDIRPPVEDSETWEISVLSETKDQIELHFDCIDNIPADLEVVLINHSSGKTQNLRMVPEVRFNPVSELTRLSVIVGTENEVDIKLKNIVPEKYNLAANYPNPFNPVTTIPVELPEAADIRLSIFNILGERVKTIYEGNLNEGRHLFVWNATDAQDRRVTSGVYICHLETETGIKFSRKMILMK